ncbi:hypothetical protein [Bradyrhizobium sp. MOS002]|jgi:hypothetical protein|uniref:hypothetical protein n=1 Tax=Bradyrhizobium sp. MOS002 TaxID=2133947 RepID=UPI000D11B995|nr:hypothetical protein [Bradyrhizobium sp. MOS002]PSO30610.1 hypothetical protein C7G41_17425 [Bradyrhizobium sp. MOS002]
MTKAWASGLGLMLLGLGNLAFAEDSPTPRRPIGPQGRTLELQTPAQEIIQLPTRPISPDSIRIQNVGDRTLVFSYWDADPSWKVISINAGSALDLACKKCVGQVSIAFNNGKALKETKVSIGNSYLLGWSDSGGVWELTSSR